MKRNKIRPGASVAFKSLMGITLLLVVFTIIVEVIGYIGFSNAILDQYADGAFYTADSASLLINADHLDKLAESDQSEEYKTTLRGLDRICNSQGATFVYVIRPDLTDYKHITFIFSTMNRNSDYDLYDFGYVRETTNEEYMEKYRKLYEGKSIKELVIRDKGYIETDSHITAMVPLKGREGNTEAILCVQRQMEKLTEVRQMFVRRVSLVLLLILIVVIFGQWLYLSRVFIRPVKKITEEASRFAAENVRSEEKLTDTIKNKDEIGVLAGAIDDMEEQVTDYVNDLTEMTKEKERIGTELGLAASIQREMIPYTFPPFPDRNEFSLYATMEPARMVGGDFYDYFLVDDDHLCIVIADVSGKGIPGALFMMASMIMLSDMAKTEKSPADILRNVNEAICKNNKQKLFVTVWMGMLEISTGRMTCANAGHEYPVIKFPDGKYELLKDAHSFVVGGMAGVRYKEYQLDLAKGTKIFLYTDGVPEAVNKKEEMFGTDRLIEVLNRDPEADPEQAIEGVRNAVNGFSGEAEQFDDMTMLCLEYGRKQ